MQVTKISMKSSQWIFCLGVYLGAVLLLASCASKKVPIGAQSDWASQNPFEAADQVGSLKNWTAKTPSRDSLRIYFSGNVNGETEPCGCAVNPKGGIDRRLTFMRQEKLSNPMPSLFVDAGNTMFPSRLIDKTQEKFLKSRVAVVAKGHVMMGIVAENVGYLDLSAGVDFLKSEAEKAHLPLLSTNWIGTDSKFLFNTEIDKTIGHVDVAILGLSRGLEGTTSPEAQLDGIKVLDPAQALSAKLASIPSEKLVIVLSDLGTGMDRDLAAKASRPVIFVGSRDLSSLEIPIHEGESMLVQGQLQGQQWGIIDMTWNPKATGWYNVKLGKTFQERWKDMLEDRKGLMARSDDEERNQELSRLGQRAKDMLAYAPTDLEHKNVYEYRLVDMTEEYKKKNELTPLMSKVKTLNHHP